MRAAVEGEDQRAAGDEFPESPLKHLVSRQAGQQRVELARETDRHPVVTPRPCGFLLAHMPLEHRSEVRTPSPDNQRHRLPLQRAAHLEDVACLFQARPRYSGGSPHRRVDQPLRREPRQRRAGQRSAHGEMRSDFVLGQFRAREESLLDDGLAERPVGAIRTGRWLGHERLQLRDRQLRIRDQSAQVHAMR